MQKTKDKLEHALEKHQDCTYLLSPPVSLSSVSNGATFHTSFLHQVLMFWPVHHVCLFF